MSQGAKACIIGVMNVSQLGEFGLIRLLDGMVHRHGSRPADLLIDVGDDAAAWRTKDEIVLATTDTLVENVHFLRRESTWQDVGWKAIAVNLSDIAAMGGIPTYALVTLGLPKDTPVVAVEQLYEGMLEIAKAHDVAIVGGDVVGAPIVVVTVTLMGRLPAGRRPLRRSTAQPGELVAVTGYLGASAAALQVLANPTGFDQATIAQVKDAHLRPRPRVREGQRLIDCGVRTAIDLSDGLLSDLTHVCEQSHLGARVWVERVPIHPLVAQALGTQAIKMALTGGEDYELLFTAPSAVMEVAARGVEALVSVVGEMVSGPPQVTLLDRAGNVIEWQDGGWDHLRD